MRMNSARSIALALLMVACSAAPAETTTTTSSTTTTTTTPTTTTSTTTPTTTTVPEELNRSPITGLEVDDPDLLNRRVMMIKIDNHPNAQPQAGINSADMVIELLVEGGFTRFITVWQESDSDFLGPNRSLRPTDYHLAPSLNWPTIVHSGGQPWVQAQARERDLHIMLPDERNPGNPPATWRQPGRRSPHNLWVNSVRVREMADDRGYTNLPPETPIWEFGPMPDANPASSVRVPFSDGTTTQWQWDAANGLWMRSQNNRPAMLVDADGNTTQIGFPVLITLYAEQYIEQAPAEGTSLPASRTIGSGRAFLFAEGSVIEGTWERTSEDEWFTLRGLAGEPLLIPPGKAWISLVPNTLGVTFEP